VLKLSDNPPVVSPWVQSVEEISGTWYVAHTKARNEKALAWDLLRRDISYFLPLYEKTTFSGGRRRRVLLPLFTSYVFFCGDEEDRYIAMTTDRIAKAIKVPDQDQLVRELAQIERAIKGEAKLDPFPEIKVGQLCRIRFGPYKGLEGEVVKRCGNVYILLRVSFISQGALMRVEPDAVEPIY